MALNGAGDVIAWHSERGRDNEFGRVDLGRGWIKLKNKSGDYDPLNPASPYAGQLLALKQARITMAKPSDPTVYWPQFTGYIDAWGPFERPTPAYARATVNLVDGFDLLETAQVPGTGSGGDTFYAAAHVDDRIKAALADAGWPVDRQSIFTGNVNLQATTYPRGTSILNVLQDAADSEFPTASNLYVDKSGVLCFRGRKFRFDPFNTGWHAAHSRVALLWRFGDKDACEADPTLLPLFDLDYTHDKEEIINSALITPAGVDPANVPGRRVTDAVSVDERGYRPRDIEGLLILDGSTTGNTGLEECQLFSGFFVDNYKDPKIRCEWIEVHAAFENEDLWDFMLQAELGDVVELHTVNPGGGGFTGEQFFIERIVNDCTALNEQFPNWTQQHYLSPRSHYDVALPGGIGGE